GRTVLLIGQPSPRESRYAGKTAAPSLTDRTGRTTISIYSKLRSTVALAYQPDAPARDSAPYRAPGTQYRVPRTISPRRFRLVRQRYDRLPTVLVHTVHQFVGPGEDQISVRPVETRQVPAPAAGREQQVGCTVVSDRGVGAVRGQ